MRKVALSSLLGTAIEYYDFILYGTMAALVFGTLFFPSDDSATATIAAFGALAAGYVARPIGGLLFGHFGDRLGRKSVLVVSMALMGVASVLIGLLPTWGQIGVWAPILLVTLRLVQGIAVGGEYGGAALMVIEHADTGRRGAWTGIMLLGSPVGALLSHIVVTIVTRQSPESFLSWGWRVPFLVSAILLIVGLYVRLSVTESPVFKAAAKAADEGRTEARPKAPLLQLLHRPKLLILACLVGIGPFAHTALVGTHVLSYATFVGFTVADVVAAATISIVTSLIGLPLASFLSDKWGRRRVILVGAAGAVAFAFPFYSMLLTGHWWTLVAAMTVGNLLTAFMMAPVTPMLSEMFGTSTRYTGVSFGYQLASMIGGGFTPLVAATLVVAFGGASLPLSLLMVGTTLVSVVAVLLISETRGRALNQLMVTGQVETPAPTGP